MSIQFPTYKPYFPALVKLLQGAIYSDDEKNWQLVQSYRQEIQEYFIKIGLLLTVVEHDEFAYLSNLDRSDAPEGFRDLPKLTRAKRLSFPVTVLCVILQKHFAQHQENVGSYEPPTIKSDDLFEEYQAFPVVARNDEWRGRQQFEAQLKKLNSELNVLEESGIEEGTYRILPSINSIVTAEFLDQIENFKLGRSAAQAGEEVELD